MSKFLGDRGCQSVWAGALSLSLGLALSAGADPLGDGQQAFEARDFARADAVWQAAADEGSAEAMVRPDSMSERWQAMVVEPTSIATP
ncbi:MAG: hypothetical protein ABGW82_08925, partial [Paracoccus sp. (in: a-proteobacteria)]